jgi:CBS domain-containing protein
MLCKDIMNTELHACRDTDTVSRCARVMRDHDVGLVPIVDEAGRLVGLVTDRDVAVRVVASDMPGYASVSHVMTTDLVTCEPGDDLSVAESRMAKHQKSRILVVDDSRCVGVIGIADVGQHEEWARAGHLLQSVSRREARGPAARGRAKR